MNDANLIRWASRQGRVCEVRPTAAALRVGRGHYVAFGYPASAAVLWILVRRRHPSWSPRRIREFLEGELGMVGESR